MALGIDDKLLLVTTSFPYHINQEFSSFPNNCQRIEGIFSVKTPEKTYEIYNCIVIRQKNIKINTVLR